MASSDDFEDDWPELDVSTLAEVARLEEAARNNPSLVRASSKAQVNNNNNGQLVGQANGATKFQQRDLFGNPINAPETSTSKYGLPGPSSNPINAVARKQWDRTAFAKSGVQRKTKGKSKAKTSKANGKGKGKAYRDDDDGDGYYDDDDDDDEDIDFEAILFDPEEASKPPKPMKLLADREACKTFVYPTNKSLRKYQYDIIAKAFFTDTLVALPTGLGKTFLAAVLMYNFYRWFPKGKIIFMAPSRPLVTQQISACHGIVGIPLKDAVELTGKDPADRRAEAWAKRRVFYCTPQTVRNDLFKGRLDPSEVICMVVDEAHRATGDYAYNAVVRFMMQKNPHFRLLALTATPGKDAEVVQAVVDSLHIGHIEVRTDESFDIRQYIHEKRVDLVKIPVQGELSSIRERFGGLMDILLKQVRDLVKTQKTDPTAMHPYLFQSAMKNVKQSGKPWAFKVLSYLGAMARCISKLLEQSVDAFYEDLKELRKDGKGKIGEVVSHRDFAGIFRDTEDMINGRGFAGHPKMVKLSELVLEHFETAKAEGELESTRIMVFCTYRQVVEEIVTRLNRFDGIRATRLVGQSADNKGKKGLGQKQQNKTLSDFKGGVYNVLVATSIGEEGLDIGELDLIVCYDAAKSPIRTLQRAGRTGRARQGRVIVLMTEGIEEDNWKIANSKYKDVQSAILSGKQFELYADCQRLIPADIRPMADKKELVIEPFDPEQLGLSRKPIPTGRRKRSENDNLDTFESGFQKASGAKIGVAKKETKATVPTSNPADQFRELPAQLQESGVLQPEQLQGMTHKVRPSLQNATIANLRSHALPRKIPAVLPATKRTLGTSSRTTALFDAIRRGQALSANSERHKAWETKTYDAFKPSNVNWWPDAKIGYGKDRSFRPLGNSEQEPIRRTAPELPSYQGHTQNSASSPVALSGPLPAEVHYSEDSDGELPDLSTLSKAFKHSNSKSIEHSPPISSRRDGSGPSTHASAGRSEAQALTSASKRVKMSKSADTQATASKPLAPINNIITIDDSDDDPSVVHMNPPAVGQKGQHPRSHPAESKKLPVIVGSDDMYDELDLSAVLACGDLEGAPQKGPATTVPGEKARPPSPGLERPTSTIPGKAFGPPSTGDDESPVVMPRKRAKKAAVIGSSPSKPHDQSSTQQAPLRQHKVPRYEDSVVLICDGPKRKLRRAPTTPSSAPQRKKKRITRQLAPESVGFFDTIAVNSDNEDSASCTSEEIAPEASSDRVFLDSEDVGNPNNMSAIYRESLMSQRGDGFHGAVVRPGAFKMRLHPGLLEQAEDGLPQLPSHRGPREDPSSANDDSQYEHGSFCVADSEDLIYSQRDDDYLDDSQT